MFLGLRSVIYPAPDLPASKAWFAAVLGVDPYFDEVFYVGFTVAGYELGLDPNADPTTGPQTFWGVANVEQALAALLAAGAGVGADIQDVGGGIRLATVREPGGAVFGIIENPNFRLPEQPTSGPGR